MNYNPEIPFLDTCPKLMLKQNHLHEYSQQHYSQYPKCGNNPEVYPLMSTQANCGILFSQKRNGRCYCMDGPWKRNTKWKKTDTQDHTVYNCIYTTIQKRQIHRDKGQIRGFEKLADVGMGSNLFLGVWWKCWGTRQCWLVLNVVNKLKAINCILQMGWNRSSILWILHQCKTYICKPGGQMSGSTYTVNREPGLTVTTQTAHVESGG